jgi:type IV fimbrial biogenesis protein FimT
MISDRRPTRGLTLIELMIGIAITAVLGTLAVPPFGAYLARQRVKAVAQHLVADLAEARHEATRRGQLLRVNFRTGTDWCYAISTDPAAGCASTGAAVLKRVSVKDHPGVALASALPIDLDGRSGTLMQAVSEVQLVSSQGDALQVHMTRLGRANICSPDGGISGVARC